VQSHTSATGRQGREPAGSGQSYQWHKGVVQELAGTLTAARQRVVVADRAAQAKVAVPDHIIDVEIDIGE
jgi:hypothetical protein